MDFNRLKGITTILMILSHILTLFVLLGLYFSGGFAFDELTTTLALLAPLFAGFTTVIIKDSVAGALPSVVPVGTRQLPWNFAFVTLIFSGSFTVYLIAIVTLKGFNIGFATFDQFKILLGISESI